jgi:hypothetical protein
MSMLRYIELKSGYGDSGPAWIAKVKLSRSKTTVYFNGCALKKAKGGGISGNYFDLESGEEFWISGIKKNGEDRHWAGPGSFSSKRALLQSIWPHGIFKHLIRSNTQSGRSGMLFMPDIYELQYANGFSVLTTTVPLSDAKMSGNEKAVARPTLRALLCNIVALKPPAALTFSLW